MRYSLGQAAKTAGRSKTTIHRAIKSGKLSASRTEDGGWSIDPAELSPAYPGTGNGTVPMERSVTAERPDVERDSPLGRPPHCEPDLLPEGQFERVAVGVGDPRNITEGSPRSVGARVGRPSRWASAYSRSISSRLLQATPRWPNGPSGGSGLPAPSTSTMTKGRVRSVSQTERTPSWARRCTTAMPAYFA